MATSSRIQTEPSFRWSDGEARIDASLQLDAGHRQIHGWCAFLASIKDDDVLSRYRELMTPEEQRQEDRFHFPHDRHRCRVVRALVRTTLARYCDVEPRDFVFSTNQYGKPAIANDSASAKGLTFNITHAHELAILVVSRDVELGVDVESTRARRFPPDVAKSYFAPDEAADVTEMSDELQQHRMFEYWTLKESYIKARGMGLSIPLDQFSFARSRGGVVEMTTAPELEDNALNWRFWQLELRDEYLAALCARRAGPAAPELVFRDIVPLVSERPLDYDLLGASPAT